jgi:hypothetical protein
MHLHANTVLHAYNVYCLLLTATLHAYKTINTDLIGCYFGLNCMTFHRNLKHGKCVKCSDYRVIKRSEKQQLLRKKRQKDEGIYFKMHIFLCVKSTVDNVSCMQLHA